MVEPEERADETSPQRAPRTSFEDGLAYLLLFSEALLELIPDGIGVLDAHLRVKSCNAAFAEAFGFESSEAARGAALDRDILFRVPVPDERDRPLGEVLRDRLSRGDEGSLYLEQVETRHPVEGSLRSWSVRASMWDTEAAAYRRMLLWVHPWKQRTEDLAEPSLADPSSVPPVPPVPPADSQDQTDRAALGEQLLDHLAVCVVDAALQVKVASRSFGELAGGAFDPESSGDHHLFATFPGLRDPAVRELLDEAGRSGLPDARQITLTSGGMNLQLEVRSKALPETHIFELLLLLREVHTMDSISTDSSASVPEVQPVASESVPDAPSDDLVPAFAVPVSLAKILEHLHEWKRPETDHVLIVEADSWTRMLWADALRETGLSKITSCETGEDVWTKQDPTVFGAIFVGLDGDAHDTQVLCECLTRELPTMPVFGLSDREPDSALGVIGDARLAGVLTGPGRETRLRGLVPALFGWGDEPGREGDAPVEPAPTPDSGTDTRTDVDVNADTDTDTDTRTDVDTDSGTNAGAGVDVAEAPATDEASTSDPSAEDESEPDSETNTTERTFDLVMLGAREADMAVLRLLYRVERMRIRLVYDPDPTAFGLALAQNLGIPAISGNAKLSLEKTPDVAVLARPELEDHLADLGLENCVRVTRDEIELFLVDPDTFVEVETTPSALVPQAEAKFESEPRSEPAPASPASSVETTVSSIREDVEASEKADSTAHASESEHTEPTTGSGASEVPEALISAIETEPTEPVSAPEPPKSPATSESQHMFFGDPLDSADDMFLAPDTSSVGQEVGALLGALDLLLDFDRLCQRTLDMSLEMTAGLTGSLMLLTDDGSELRIAAGAGLSEVVVEKTRQRVGDGIAGRVAQDGEPLLLVGTIGDERFHASGERLEIRSSVCVPILAEGHVIGVLSVNSDPTREPFGNAELKDVARLGRSVGSALDRSRQLRRMRGRSFELSVRAEIEALASTSDDLLSRLRRITARVVQMLSLDTCGIWMQEPERGGFSLRAVSGLSVTSMNAITVPVGTGLVGWVAKNLRPLVLRSQVEGPEDPRLTNIGVPIRYQTELLGVLTVESTSTSAMDDERVALIASVASVVGDHIGRAQAYENSEHKVTQLSALSELGVAFAAATERVSLGKLVTFSASTLLESDVSTIRLLREGMWPTAPQLDMYEVLAAHGASVGGEDPLSELEDRIVAEVVTRQRPCTRMDLPDDEAERILQRSNVTSFVGIPMWSADALIGVLVVFRVVDPTGLRHDYQDQDLEIAERLGDYAAAAALRFVGSEPGA